MQGLIIMIDMFQLNADLILDKKRVTADWDVVPSVAFQMLNESDYNKIYLTGAPRNYLEGLKEKLLMEHNEKYNYKNFEIEVII